MLPSDHASPAYLQSTCSICFEDLRQSDKVSAIVCGHIYHHGCISQWMAAKKQCPSCRRSVPKNGFVEKLFFDVQRMDGEAEKVPTTDYREEHYKLWTTLKVEREKAEHLNAENKSLKAEVKALEKKILKEKDKYRAEIPRLQATINHLQISTEEAESLKRDLSEAKCKLRASEFYKILSTHNPEADKQIGEYLRKGGNLDTEKFFQLQKAQIKDLTEKRRDAAKEIEILKMENQSLKRKEQSEAVLRRTLKESVLELRERANINTPINNKRLRQVLEEETPTNVKRKSLGFDDSSPNLRGADLSFFKLQENRTPGAPSTSKPTISSDSKFAFDNDDDDAEYFKTPKISIEKKKPVPPKILSNNDSFEFDIQVPQNIINRIPPKIPSFKKSQTAIEKSKSAMEPIARKVSQNNVKENSSNVNVPPSTSNSSNSAIPYGKSSSSQFTKSIHTSNLKRHESTDTLVPKKTAQAPPVMIDVHCHLTDNKFQDDIDAVISHAQTAGVGKLINVPEFESQFEKSIEISKKWTGVVYTGIGIHPIQKRGKSAQMKHLLKMEQLFVEHERDIVCVGECGLDHTSSQFKLRDSDYEEQERVFKWQIDLAKHFDKPLNIHSRSAARKTIEVLSECQVAADQVVLHAFDGDSDDVKLGVDAGYLFSVPPSFARTEKILDIFKQVPLRQLLLETDSPALGFERGVRNVPSNLRISAEFVSRMKNLPVEDVIKTTISNAKRIFKIS